MTDAAPAAAPQIGAGEQQADGDPAEPGGGNRKLRSPSSEKTVAPPSLQHSARVAALGALPRAGSTTPPSVATVSDSDGWASSPPSRTPSNTSDLRGPHSQQPLRTPIPFVNGQQHPHPPHRSPPQQRQAHPVPAALQRPAPTAAPVSSSRGLSFNRGSRPPPPPSQSSVDTGGQRFTLRDLLISSPSHAGVARRPSQRSSNSKRSDSERGASSIGETTASLSQKYGVCDRIAIGKGATSVVRLVHKWDRSEEKLYAVKEFRKRRKNETEKEYVKKLTAEFCISSTLHHPNIVETVDLLQDEQQHWCEVMEYCPGGDLYAAIKKGSMAESEIECCFRQIISGVDYLHAQGVAHRDIKPENIYFDAKGSVKLGDYGASTVYRLPWETTVHLSTGLCGSEPYIAPEQFSGKPYDARLVDVWACGIVYYCMQCQELPWRVAQHSETLFAAYAQACATASKSQDNSSFPAMVNQLSPRTCRPVLRKMLDPDPKKRWNIRDILSNSWVCGIEVCSNSDKPKHVHGYARSMLKVHAEKLHDSHR